MKPDRIDLSTYIVTSIWFGCNNDCRLCMLAEMKRDLPPIGFDRFRSAMHHIKSEGRFRNLILSGAEVTTFPDLERYVRFAAAMGYFERIQIQTNGRRLKDDRYIEQLVKWGVNEFFVSIHGLEQTHDTTTRRRGSFQETMAGFRNLATHDVNVISNSVLTSANYEELPQLLSILVQESISEFHLWNYFPMAAEDPANRLVRLSDVNRLLPKLENVVSPRSKPLVLKSFPECISVSPPICIDSTYPVTLLPDRFWNRFGENRFGQCFHRERGACRALSCWGLSEAYIRAFGNEHRHLKPIADSGDKAAGHGGCIP